MLAEWELTIVMVLVDVVFVKMVKEWNVPKTP